MASEPPEPLVTTIQYTAMFLRNNGRFRTKIVHLQMLLHSEPEAYVEPVAACHRRISYHRGV